MRRSTIPLLTILLLLVALPGLASEAEAPAAEASMSDEVADALLLSQIKLDLLTQLGLDALAVDVDVDGGAVTLTGTVNERSTRELAAEVARAKEGVAEVDNRLSVADSESSGTPIGDAVAEAEREVADAALEARIKGRLLAEIGRHALGLEVEAADGEVTLRGAVPDEERRGLALAAARETKGAREVHDLLEVRSGS